MPLQIRDFMQKIFTTLAVLVVIAAGTSSYATTSVAVAVHNSDMEQITRDPKTHAVIPVDWKAGGDLTFLFAAVGPSVTDAASGSYYGRLTTQNAAGKAFWIVSDFIPSNSKKQAVVNFSVRSTFTDVRVSIHQFDAKWNELQVVDGPAINFTDLNWVKYAEKAGAYALALDPKATNIELVFSGLAQAGNNQLDIDSVSVEMQ